MSLKKYMLWMFAATLIAYLMFFTVLFYFNPFESGSLGIIFFYLSFGMVLIGTVSLIGLIARILFANDKLMFRKVLDSFRQSILVAAAVLTALVFQRNDLLTPLTIILLVLVISILEVFFLTHHNNVRA